MRVLAASDLDRTLIRSAAAAGLDAAPPAAEAVCAEEHAGRPASFLSRRAADLVARLVADDLLVPVTTRTVAQTRRIGGPFAGARLVVCANGGRLLRDGAEDAAFASAVARDLADAGAPLPEVAPVLRDRLAGVAATGPLRVADDLFAYLVGVDRAAAERGLALVAAPLEALGWRASVQGRKLYAVPVALSKAAAVHRLRVELGAETVVAAGDSLLDADMLLAADAAIRPAEGELHEAGLRAPHLAVTAGTGLAAGEEIAAWLAERARAG